MSETNKLEKIVKTTDNNALTIALSNIISGVIIACALLMSTFIISCSFIWGWVGFATIVGIFTLIVSLIFIGHDE